MTFMRVTTLLLVLLSLLLLVNTELPGQLLL